MADIDPNVLQAMTQNITLPSGGIATLPAPTPTPTAGPEPGSNPMNPFEGLNIAQRFAKGFLLGASKIAQETLLNQQREKMQHNALEQQIKMEAFGHLIESGKPVTPDLVKGFGLDPKQTTIWNMIAAQNKQLRAEAQQRAMEMFSRMGQESGDVAPGAPGGTAPSAISPFLPQPAPVAADQPGGGQGGIGAPQIPSAPTRPAVSRTMTINPETGKTSLSGTVTSPSGLELERAARERAKFPTEYKKGIVELEAAQNKLEREKTIFDQQQEARTGIQTLMEQSSATDDPRVKQKSFEQALAIAAGAGLKDVETLLKAHMTPDKPVKVDLGIPHEAEFVASTGLNPKTMEPVDPTTHKAAIAATKAREARIVRQNEALAKVRTGEIGERVAVSGAVRGLVKESDAVATFVQRVDQIEGALKTMEKNLNVYPTTVLGRPSAQFSRLIQDDRGRVMAQIEQAINILQSAEARFMAAEVGRIPQQLERQWREVLADPSKVTRKTAEALIASTRQRLRDMGAGRERAVRARAGVATRLGVPKPITDAFVQGDTDALKLSLGDAFGSGALPPTLNEDDLK